ncbi:hypothetical protein LTR62_005276 [Meristemomyces frigidus]|uniref:NmrA-like domain-containing protein n=1 Tax=Meristemomyces frigidus TaxID=1508187 RepID=A0AAN7TEU8_9PEZI|nr:hypothetical protein LTR62_005276 [Meristemomyces frigidus]
MSTPRKLLVAGATGKQGGALIRALLAKQSQPFEIYALTRNATSRSAQVLAKQPNVRIIQGDFDSPKAIFKQVKEPWGFFSVTMPMNAWKEEAQGKAMTAAALDAGVKHIVFTATDRGGDGKSDTEPTNVPHFASKYNIEQDIKAHANASASNNENKQELTWTFLRPVAFYENLSNDFMGKGFTSMWRLNGPDRPLQLVSTSDIGRIAAEAFLHSDNAEYRNQSISLAGDELSPDEAAKSFTQVTGKIMPDTYGFVGWGLRKALHEQLGIMFDWFVTDGFGVNVKALRKRYPYMQDFGTWLREESAWKESSS